MTGAARLPLQVPQELAEEFLKRLPFVAEGLSAPVLSDDRQSVSFQLAPGGGRSPDDLAALIGDVAVKLCGNHRANRSRTLASRVERPSAYEDDPHPALTASGDLIVYGPGRMGLGPRLSALMAAFDAQIREVADGFAAPPYTFPSLIGADTLDRCRYYRNFPTGLGFVSHLREDHGRLQEFARSAAWDGEGLTVDPASLSRVECLLSPAVCFHYYAQLQGRTLEVPHVVTAVGKCFRYESTNMQGLERLWDFTMREIIFVGTAAEATGGRERSLQACLALLDEWRLPYEISTAIDPFFADAYAAQAAFQQGFELKFEVLVPLPYSGKRLAVGSLNYHQDFFGRSFDITAGGAPAHTSCLAFGLERLVLAFVAQHGPDERGWPAGVLARMQGPAS